MHRGYSSAIIAFFIVSAASAAPVRVDLNGIGYFDIPDGADFASYGFTDGVGNHISVRAYVADQIDLSFTVAGITFTEDDLRFFSIAGLPSTLGIGVHTGPDGDVFHDLVIGSSPGVGGALTNSLGFHLRISELPDPFGPFFFVPQAELFGPGIVDPLVFTFSVSVTEIPVPEPATLALLGVNLLCLGLRRRPAA